MEHSKSAKPLEPDKTHRSKHTTPTQTKPLHKTLGTHSPTRHSQNVGERSPTEETPHHTAKLPPTKHSHHRPHSPKTPTTPTTPTPTTLSASDTTATTSSDPAQAGNMTETMDHMKSHQTHLKGYLIITATIVGILFFLIVSWALYWWLSPNHSTRRATSLRHRYPDIESEKSSKSNSTINKVPGMKVVRDSNLQDFVMQNTDVGDQTYPRTAGTQAGKQSPTITQPLRVQTHISPYGDPGFKFTNFGEHLIRNQKSETLQSHREYARPERKGVYHNSSTVSQDANPYQLS